MSKIESKEHAEEMLAALSEFYAEPVKPVSRYCAALQLWAGAITERASRSKSGSDIKDAGDVRRVFLMITKSNLLARLIYGGEPMRTEMCPEHRGKWSGCSWEPITCGCDDGANITGWLRPTRRGGGGG